MSIRLLTFDLDDTLWDVGRIVRRADQEMMQWLAVHYPAMVAQFDAAGFFELRREVHAANPEQRHDLNLMRRKTLELALLRSGHDDAIAAAGSEAAFAVFAQWRNTVDFFPEVISTLEGLRQQYPLYALSNGGADIARIGLSPIFSLHLSAASVGAAKPNPAIYLRALEHAGVNPEEAIHIGDHPVEDIEAAQKVGMRTIWMNWQGKEWPLERRADGEVWEFRELPGIITELAGA